MRIELNSGGLTSGAVMSGFQSDLSDLVNKARRAVSAFQTVRSYSTKINGGVGGLQSAVDQISSCIQRDEARSTSLQNLRQKANGFIELARRIDLDVGGQVNRNKNEFYRINPWSRPPQTEAEKKWYEKAWEWGCGKYEQVKDSFNHLKDAAAEWGKSVADSLSKAWESAKSWFIEHAGSILKLAVSALIVVSLVAVIVLCPYTAPVFIATMGLIGAATKTATKLYDKAVEKGLDNITFDDFADATFKGTVKGAASGVSNGIGMYYGPGWRFVSGELLTVGADMLVNETDYFIEHGSLKGSNPIVQEALFNGTVDNTFESIFFAIGFKGKTPISNMHNQILYGSKEMAVQKILSDKMGDIAWNIGGSNISTLVNTILRETVGNSLPTKPPDDFEFIDINISGEGIGKTISDTVKGTLKKWLKQSIKPQPVY